MNWVQTLSQPSPLIKPVNQHLETKGRSCKSPNLYKQQRVFSSGPPLPSKQSFGVLVGFPSKPPNQGVPTPKKDTPKAKILTSSIEHREG